MDTKEHDKIMTDLTKVFANNNLKIGEAISVWHSLGMFLFSHADKEHNTEEKIRAAMSEYLATVIKGEAEKKETEEK